MKSRKYNPCIERDPLPMATIRVLLAINFGNVNENTCLMYTMGVTPWLEGQTAQFTDSHKSEIVREVKAACISALLEMYQPFVDTEFYIPKSIPLTKAMRAAIMNFNNNGLSEIHTLEALKLMIVSQDHMLGNSKTNSRHTNNECSLTPNEMKAKFVPASFNNFTVENCTVEFIKHHALRLYMLYVLCGCSPVEHATRIPVDNYLRHVLTNIPCRTPEGVIGITSIERFRNKKDNPDVANYKVLEQSPYLHNVADEYIAALWENT